MAYSIPFLVIGLFLLDSVLAGCMSLESCPFLLGWQICWHIIVHSILLCFLYFRSNHCDFSFFSSYFVYLGFSFFLVSLARSLSILSTFSKNQLLVWLIFFLLFFECPLYWFLLWSLWFPSFCWLKVLFV